VPFALATPVTTPPALTVAIVGLRLDHTPPGVVFDSVTEVPGHIGVLPVIGFTTGKGLTVNVVLLAKPVATVTKIGPLLALAGTVATICVAFELTIVALVPLNDTEVTADKLVPLILTLLPGQPLLVESEVIVGLI
jgi:hypothetical protein